MKFKLKIPTPEQMANIHKEPIVLLEARKGYTYTVHKDYVVSINKNERIIVQMEK